jgi:hypothetical protein
MVLFKRKGEKGQKTCHPLSPFEKLFSSHKRKARIREKNSERLINSIRFSFGFNTTDEQIVEAAHETASIVRSLRKQIF